MLIMSYEELLALTERIGNVSTGISEETIVKCLKQRKYISLTEETPSDVESCCICQEEYVEEDEALPTSNERRIYAHCKIN
ncbi:probable E3 ubiquitin-protein ligase HIP1 isoform X2 [Asparagus officinalis]|uniref:probable E3 ubiquitin-protein ligase HIP1 isoform X2 n=1 Tax=Asparagus officinalis TaxID=4686 RepID=UPI00098DFF83|nr:probable E3 ubiquitin-protein ligase HIP1 isoform X2 [Asparagus officinalis]